MNKALEFMLNKNLDTKSKTYVNIFSCDDKKKDKKTESHFLELTKDSIPKIIEEAHFYNIGSFGTFISLNPLSTTRRKKEFVKNINFVFIDLDNAKEEDFNTVKQYLEAKSIKYSYTAQSGNGYHILLEIDMVPDKEDKVKNFLKYLHANVSSKVDTATGDLTRLIRVPESEHNKKEPFELKTLYLKNISKSDIKFNNDVVESLQIKEIKDKSNMNYLKEIKRDDIFFNTIIASSNQWSKYKKLLNESTSRNDVFVKNFGFFLNQNPGLNSTSLFFFDSWDKSRVKPLGGWIKKAKEENMQVNYFELLTWSKENNSNLFTELLLEQTRHTFLDSYEVYYLEEEKTENNCLLYYPGKNYYLQKSIQEVILNIYYDCKEKGTDLIKELNLKELYEKWDSFNFKKQITLIMDQIRRLIEQENRIKLVYNINYAPNEEKFITLDDKRFFNIYKKSLLLDTHNNVDLKEYEFRHIKELIFNLCGKDEEYYDWFINWLAWQVQYPTSKLPTAVILQGEQGTGKGVLKNHVLDAIFGMNCQEINQTHLESAFNEYLLGKQVIVANEVMHNENRQVLPNILKNLVTDEYITIQRKFRKDLVIRNYTHWIFCTNSDNPIKIEEGDRRYSVFKSKKLRGGGKKAIQFVKTLIENKDHELPVFLQYLKTIEVDEFLVSVPKMTEAKEEIIDLNKDTITKFLEDLPRYNDLEDLFMKIFGSTKSIIFIGEGDVTIDTDSFYRAYVEWCNKNVYKGIFQKQNFSKKLSQLGISSFPRKFKEHPDSPKWNSVRVYGRDNIEKFMEI